ncbi:hypothetical protein [uncultured Microscilla sp.]|uniref:hypothetical protein n=1 Tax=uncultured Microscilla sp. TaxID=432653 RepID=UPI00262CFA4C|nr:hypothetical protein [uncultured Microscilla sp.]
MRTQPRAKDILEEHAHLSLIKQQGTLEVALETHRSQTKQHDDILWMGIKR